MKFQFKRFQKLEPKETERHTDARDRKHYLAAFAVGSERSIVLFTALYHETSVMYQTNECNTLLLSGPDNLNCSPIRQHLSYDDCLKDKREDYQNCSVLYCVTQVCTIVCTLI